MLSLTICLICCFTTVYGLIPSNICYQHHNIRSACDYGNLTVALIGKSLLPKDCNSQVDVKVLGHVPYLYINSTNSSERFTVLMLDLGSQGRGPPYLQWMVTNVSINTVNHADVPPNNLLVAYERPLLMHSFPQPHLVQILVFRHGNVLRVPFGELWVTRKQNFQLSTLFSNTLPNLQLCGPVAGIQFWVYDSSTPSNSPIAPGPVYVPVMPVQPVQGYVPVGVAPVQPGFSPPQVQHQPTFTNFPKKNSGSLSQPLKLLGTPFVVLVVLFHHSSFCY